MTDDSAPSLPATGIEGAIGSASAAGCYAELRQDGEKNEVAFVFVFPDPGGAIARFDRLAAALRRGHVVIDVRVAPEGMGADKEPRADKIWDAIREICR